MSVLAFPSLKQPSLVVTASAFRSFATPDIHVAYPSGYGPQTQIFLRALSSLAGGATTIGGSAATAVQTVSSYSGQAQHSGFPVWAVALCAAVGAALALLAATVAACYFIKRKRKAAQQRGKWAQTAAAIEGQSHGATREKSGQSSRAMAPATARGIRAGRNGRRASKDAVAQATTSTARDPQVSTDHQSRGYLHNPAVPRNIAPSAPPPVVTAHTSPHRTYPQVRAQPRRRSRDPHGYLYTDTREAAAPPGTFRRPLGAPPPDPRNVHQIRNGPASAMRVGRHPISYTPRGRPLRVRESGHNEPKGRGVDAGEDTGRVWRDRRRDMRDDGEGYAYALVLERLCGRRGPT